MGPGRATALLILGVRGSGNERLAQVCAALGWHRLEGAKQLNTRILRLADRNWADPKPMPADWAVKAGKSETATELRELLETSFAAHGRIVVDDPRLARTLPLWLAALEQLGTRIICLFPISAPPKLAGALDARAGLAPNHAMLLWESYFLEAEKHSRSLPRAVVTDYTLSTDWRSALALVLEGTKDEITTGPLAETIPKIISAGDRSRQDTAEPGEEEAIKPRIASLLSLCAKGLDQTEEFDGFRDRWTREWAERSPGPERSNFGDMLARNMIGRSRDHAEQGRLDDALSAVREAIDLDRAEPSYHDALARLARDQGDIAAAVAAAETATQLAPDSANGFLLLGQLLGQADRLEAAEQAHRRAAELGSSEARFARAHSGILRQMGRIEDAIRAACDAVEAEPDNGDFLLYLAKLEASAGDHAAAQSRLAAAHAAAPDSVAIMESYRDLLVRLGRDGDALRISEKLARALNSPATLADIAGHHIDLGDAAAAEAALNDAVQSAAAMLAIEAADGIGAFLANPPGDAGPADSGRMAAIMTVLAHQRAAALAADSGLQDEGESWPLGAGRPARSIPPVPRYGSLGDRWARARFALRHADLAFADQFRTRPALSVMIPVYNVQDTDWLTGTIESVLANRIDGQEIDVTLVDDASSNNVAEAVAQSFGSALRYVRNPDNLGIVANHNFCIRLARGECVHILHQDDRIDGDFYQRIAGPLLGDDRLVAAFSRARLVDQDGGYRSDQSMLHETAGPVEGFSRKIALRQRILFPSMIVRRSAYEMLGGFSDSLVFAFDLEMWARIAALGPVWHDPVPLADYRLHPWSVTNSLEARTRLIDGMRAAHLNADQLPASERATILPLSLYRLIRREWDRISRQGMAPSATEQGTDLIEFLTDGIVDRAARDRLIEMIGVTDRDQARGAPVK